MIPTFFYFLILSPILVFLLGLFQTQGLFFDWHLLLPTLSFTARQAALSALISTALGFLCAPAYAALRARAAVSPVARVLFGFVRATLILPNIMSPLLVTTALLVTLPDFPFGWIGILLGHFYFNVGLATVQLGENWWTLRATVGVVAESLGGGGIFNVVKIYAPLMIKNIFQSWILIFSICFSSFYIPLVFGGSRRFFTLEAMIYEQLRSNGNIAGALGVSFVQMASQFLIMFFVWKLVGKSHHRNQRDRLELEVSPSVVEKVSLPLLGIVVGFILVPLFSILKSASQASDFSFMNHFWTAALNSIFLSTLASMFVVIALLTIFASRSEEGFKFIPTLSGVLVGFACVIAFGSRLFNTQWAWYVASIVGLFISYLGFFQRGAAASLLESKVRYQKVSWSLGANTLFQISRVYIPANKKALAGVFILCFCWCLGDVSVLSFTAPAESTLTLLLKSLQGSYRLEEASVVAVVLILASALGIFAMGYLESGKNSESAP